MNKKKNRDVAESLEFIIERMATKDDVRDIVREELKETKDDVSVLKDDVSALKNKVTGIYNLLEEKARKETDLKIPRRVHDLEESEYGVGKSRHPKHVPL